MAWILLALALPLGVAGAAYGETAGGSWAAPFGNFTEVCGSDGTSDDDDGEFTLTTLTKATCFAKCEELDSGAAEYSCDASDPTECWCWYDFPRALHSCVHVWVCARAPHHLSAPGCRLQLPGSQPVLAEPVVHGSF